MAKKKDTATEPTLQLKDVPASIAGYAAGPMFYARLVRDFPGETLGEDGIEAMLEDARVALGKGPDEIMANAMADWPQFVVNYRAWLDERRHKRNVLAELAQQGIDESALEGNPLYDELKYKPSDEQALTLHMSDCGADSALEHGEPSNLGGEETSELESPDGQHIVGVTEPEARICEHCGEETTTYIVTPTEQIFCLDGEACRERKHLQEEKSKAEGKRIEKVVEQHRVKLTTEEMKALADRTAENLRRKADLEQQKAQSTKSYAQKIGEVDAELHKDGALYREGHEMRDVECQVIKDYKSGWVTTIRLDTGEETHRRRLRHDEAQIPLPIEKATPGDLAAANIGGTYGTNPHPGGELAEEHTPGDEPVVEDDAPTAFELAMDEAAAAAQQTAMSGEPIRPHCHGGPLGPECGEGESLCSFYDECRDMVASEQGSEDMPPLGAENVVQAQKAV